MRSRAALKAHPLHPSLIPFPFAFLAGALLFDALGILQKNPAFCVTAGHLTVAGVAAGVLAAVPGLLDYLYTVPPASSGKTRATRHALLNVTALVLFTAGWFLREPDGPSLATMACEIAGAGALVYAGWLGGTLLTRNMIGVDHRYAGAGKWNEARLSGPAGKPLVIARKDELKNDQMKLLVVNGHRLVLARTKDSYRAFDDRCTHRGGSLADGVVIDGIVQCAWHGSQFDTRTGKVTCGPAKENVRSYEVTENAKGEVLLVSPPE